MARDWDDAFANMAHIPGSGAFPEAWAQDAADFRARCGRHERISYGDKPPEIIDTFSPQAASRGLFIFVHGGYWMRTSPDDWSHLAEGAVALGYTAALIGYTLTPAATIPEITQQVARGIRHVARAHAGPIHLVGHSAGAHLAARALCDDTTLEPAILMRIASLTGLGGVYDLRPLLMTEMNWTLGLTGQSAALESPILHRPKVDVPMTIWVGADERPEFVRQSRAMALVWEGLGAEITLVEEAGAHHFSILDGLRSADAALMRQVMAR
ncbi:MAG: alpha/beta hydrolase [Pseudomonadota bacterium]